MEKSNVLSLLHADKVNIEFIKKDGTTRLMTCTLSPKFLPQQIDVEEEIQKKTIDALLVTPVNLKEYVTAKAVTGISLAFLEGLLIAVLLGVLKWSTLPALIIFLLLGSILVTSIAFMIGSISKNFVSLIMNGILPLLVLILPGALLIFPSSYSPIINAIPTYHLINPLDGILNYHFSLSQYFPQIIYLILFDISFFIIGFTFLKRKVT